MTMSSLRHHPFQSLPQQESLRKSRYVPRSFVQHDYHDRSNDLPDFVPAITRGGVPTLFPTKLHGVLDKLAEEGLGHICSWQPHGRAFLVHKPKSFEAILPKYFGKMKMSSFQRQLNLYGFVRLTHGPDKGGYYHELFLKDRVYLTSKIHRRRIKGNKTRSASNPDHEPNFYAMPPMGPVPQPGDAMAVPAAALPPMHQVQFPVPALSQLPPRQVSLTELDFLQSLPLEKLDLEQPQPVAPKQETADEELDAKFWSSMEALLDNTEETDACLSDEDLGSDDDDDLDDLDDIFELPTQQNNNVAVAPRPAEEVLRSDATVLDAEVTNFLTEMFQKEQEPSFVTSALKVPQIKGISMAGGANAVAYARRGTFRRRSACNAAA